MDSIQRRDRRARLKQRLQNELEKDLRNEFENESLLEEGSEASSTCGYQETPTSTPLTAEDIVQMETNLSFDAAAHVNVTAHVDVTEDLVPMTQFPILKDIYEEDDCITEEEDEEIMLENDHSYLDTLHTQKYRFILRISIRF
jgi:hypothetical protein